MSDSCRTPDPRLKGFTLLEVLFVLLLIGLVGGLVVPRVGLIYDNMVLRGEREQILRDLADLPWEAKSGLDIPRRVPVDFFVSSSSRRRSGGRLPR